MRVKHISILAISVLLIGACSNNEPKPEPKKEKKEEVAKVAPAKPQGVKLSDLKSGGVTNLLLKGPKEYKSGEPVRFIVDTKNKSGYLYVIYEDSKGDVGVLYPNPKSPLSEVGGKYTFPDDFGLDPKSITASKDCKDCKKDRTVIYALLTEKPILDVQSIDKTTLHNITGLGSDKKGDAKSKGLSVDFDAGSNANSGNVNIGVFEFYVK